MAWKQRPMSGLSETSMNKSIHWQRRENFQSSDLYVFLTFILIVVAFSAFGLNGISTVDEKYGPRNRGLALHLDSFSIIDFRVMGSQLVSNWTAKFIFISENNDVEIPIEPFDLLVFYKGTNLVSCASMAGTLMLKKKYQPVMEVEFSPEGCNKLALSIDDEVLQGIEEDLKKGKIGLSLKLGYRVEFEPSCHLDLEFNSTKLSAERFSGKLNVANKCHIPLPAA